MNKRVLITGTNSGIGYQLALDYAETNIIFNTIYPPLTSTPSAKPIGLPEDMIEDPVIVGRVLARKIESRKKIIATDWKNALGIRMIKLFPYFIGRKFSKFTLQNQMSSAI